MKNIYVFSRSEQNIQVHWTHEYQLKLIYKWFINNILICNLYMYIYIYIYLDFTTYILYFNINFNLYFSIFNIIIVSLK